MSRNRKIRETRRVKAILRALFKRRRYFEAYGGGPGFTIIKGRKPGVLSLYHLDPEWSGTVTGRLHTGNPELAYLPDTPVPVKNWPIQSMIAEIDAKSIEARIVAALELGFTDGAVDLYLQPDPLFTTPIEDV